MALTVEEENFLREQKARYEKAQQDKVVETKREVFRKYRDVAFDKTQSELQVEWQGYEDARDIPPSIVTELKEHDPTLPDWE